MTSIPWNFDVLFTRLIRIVKGGQAVEFLDGDD